MSEKEATFIDTINWDDIAKTLMETFAAANHARQNGYSREEKNTNAEITVQAALALAQVAAQARARAEKEDFKIRKA